MKHLNFANRKVFEIENEGGAGGADGAAQQPQNNDKNNVEDFSGMWNTNTEGSGPSDNSQMQPSNNSQAADVPADEAFGNYINGLNLGNGIDMRAIADGIAEGNYEALQTGLMQGLQNVYQRAILDANKIVEAKTSKAIEEAVSKATGKSEANLAMRELNDKLPFTKDPAIAPVAKAVFSQLLNQNGQDVAKAINATREYFKRTSNLSAKDLGLPTPPKNSPGSGGFNRGGVSYDDSGEETDFVALLTGN